MDISRRTWVTPLVKQWWVVSGILMNKLGQGMSYGFTSSLIGALLVPGSEININTEIASWLGSSIGIGTLIGYPIGSIAMTKYGRKLASIGMNIPAVVGNVLLACGYSVTELLIGRLLFGFTAGYTALSATMIVGEFTSPQYRGMFLILTTSFLSLGILVVHLVANYLYWRVLAGVCALPFVASIIITSLWPESPYWLAEKQQFDKSEEVFYWLRGKTPDSSREMMEILKKPQGKQISKTLSEKFKEFLMKFKKNNFRKPFIILIFTAILFECSGRHIIPVYAVLVLRGMTSNEDSLFKYTLVLDTIITLSTFTSSHLIRKCKLRSLLFTTGGMAVVLLNLACLTLYLCTKGILSADYAWVPIACFCLFVCVTNISCTAVPLTIVGEIFPMEHRAVGLFVSGNLIGVALILTMKITPNLLENFNTYGTFPFFGGGTFISLLVLYFMLPETKGKTLQEIEDFFTHGNKKRTRDDDDDEVVINMLKKNNEG